MDVNELIANKISEYMQNDPVYATHIPLDSNIEYKDIINMWRYFKSTNKLYEDKFNDISLKSRRLTQNDIDTYSYEYQKYPLLNNIFELITQKSDHMVIFYIKSTDEFLVFLKSDIIWNNWIDDAKNYNIFVKFKRIVHSQIWLLYMALPNIVNAFNDYFIKKEYLDHSIYVFVY